MASLEATIANYEAKVSGLENEMEMQKEQYDKKLEEFSDRFQSLGSTIDALKNDYETRLQEGDKSHQEDVNKRYEEMSAKFTEASESLDDLKNRVKTLEEAGNQNNSRIQENFDALQDSFRDIQKDNSRKMERVVDDSKSSREMLSWLEPRLKDSKVEYTGKIHEIAHVTREQVGWRV